MALESWVWNLRCRVAGCLLQWMTEVGEGGKRRGLSFEYVENKDNKLLLLLRNYFSMDKEMSHHLISLH